MQNEKWQVEVKGVIYDCDLAELEQWIADRALLPEDNVRRGSRGWVKAGRVPLLQKFFAGEKSQKTAELTLTVASNLPTPNLTAKSDACHFHADESAVYACRECGKLFCKACPKSYGTVRICPVCGEMCQPFKDAQRKLSKAAERASALQNGYGLRDFGKAWAYPFKFWQSLALGAVFIAFLSLGGFFGVLLANAILFGCIAQAVSFVAHGDFEQNFMPDFDDFNVWDDVAKPFLLSLSVLFVSYLPAGLIMFALFFSVLNSLSNPVAVIKAQQENSAAAVKESASTQILLDPKEAEKHLSAENMGNAARQSPPLDEKDVKALINGSGEEQAAAAKKVEELSRNTPDNVTLAAQKTDSQIMYAIIEPIFKSSMPIILLLIIALLWAIFYLPMALTIAGYTGSLTATINPLVGIDTMRRMGGVYFAAFFFCLIVQIANLMLSGFIGYLTKPFDLPLVGNLPAGFLIAVCSFYFSLVIAFLLGSALYKTADKLGIGAV